MVSVPSGETAVTVPLVPGIRADSSRYSSRPGVNSSSSGIRLIVNELADVDRRQRRGGWLDVVGAGDRVPVRAGGGVAEQTIERRFDGRAHHVLPFAGLVMSLGPGQLEDIGEKALGQPVPAHDAFRQGQPSVCETNPPVRRDQPLMLQPAHHLADRGAADLQPIGDARLDDVDVVLLQLEDALAVLFESRMVLTGHCHGAESTWRPVGRI